jgi:hypothetical protein
MLPGMNEETPNFFNLEDFVPSLRQAVEAAASFDLTKLLGVAVPIKDPEKHPTPVFDVEDRSVIHVTEGKNSCVWKTESLRSLFRGNKQPPVLGDYPEAYEDSFMLLDFHALEFSRIFGDLRDAEMLEIYSWLRRRPDGKSLSPAHCFMWQAAALMLGTRPLSQAEFEAIINRLERSCRTFQESPSSKNYITTLRDTLGEAR